MEDCPACFLRRDYAVHLPSSVAGVPSGGHHVNERPNRTSHSPLPWRHRPARSASCEPVSAAIGGEFFRSVVEHLAEVLQADCVYIGEFLGGHVERVKTLAASLDHRPVSFEYELAGSAAAPAALGKLVYLPCTGAETLSRRPDASPSGMRRLVWESHC